MCLWIHFTWYFVVAVSENVLENILLSMFGVCDMCPCMMRSVSFASFKYQCQYLNSYIFCFCLWQAMQTPFRGYLKEMLALVSATVIYITKCVCWWVFHYNIWWNLITFFLIHHAFLENPFLRTKLDYANSFISFIARLLVLLLWMEFNHFKKCIYHM